MGLVLVCFRNKGVGYSLFHQKRGIGTYIQIVILTAGIVINNKCDAAV